MSIALNNQQKYQQCTKCIMDTTDPLITFSNGGICSHCLSYEDWLRRDLSDTKSHDLRTQKMVSEIKSFGRGKQYDCIMGLSGGVDSSYLAYYATKVLGLRALVVHVDSGWNSELAIKNIENIVKKLDLDLHTLVIDWEEMRDLQRAFFLSSVPNCDIPQDHSFIAALYSEARKFGLKHVLNGGNMATESILPNSWGYDATDWIHIKDIHKKFGQIKLRSYPRITLLQKGLFYPVVYKMKVHRPLEYIPYNKAEVKEFLKKELDWRDYGGKHYESKFTHFFQAHYLPEKYGFDKRLAHLSSLIVSGQMSRDEALAEMERPLYDPVELEQDRQFFIKKLGFSREEWEQIMRMAPMTEYDYKNEIQVKKILKFLLALLKFPIRVIRFIKRKTGL